MNLPCYTKVLFIIMPVPSKFVNYKRIGKFLLGISYITYAINVSKTQITDTYNEIYEIANTVGSTEYDSETNKQITHAITIAWTLPIIPAILLFNPPYQAKKTIEKYLPSSKEEDRV